MTAPKPDPTPTRASARIAAKVELSSDEDDAAARRKSYAAARAAGAPKKGIIGELGGLVAERDKICVISRCFSFFLVLPLLQLFVLSMEGATSFFWVAREIKFR